MGGQHGPEDHGGGEQQLSASPSRVSIKRSLSKKQSGKLSRGTSPSKRHPHQEQEPDLVTWDTPGTQLLRLLTHTRGKLGNFVSLNTTRLEEKLLAEQERQMALEQQELLAEWAAPSRRATEAPEASTRQSRSLSHAGSHLSTASRVHRHMGSTHRASMYSGVLDEHETSMSSHRSMEDPLHAQGSDYDLSSPSFPISPNARRQCRPDIISSRSTRLVELVSIGQQRLALMAAVKANTTEAHHSDVNFNLPARVDLGGGDAFSSPRQSKLSLAGSAHELFGNKSSQRNSVSQLHGCALASQALVTIGRAERLLEKLKENASLDDSRPSTSEGELRMYEQQLQMLRDARSTMIDVPDPIDDSVPEVRTLSRAKSRRQTAVSVLSEPPPPPPPPPRKLVYIKGLDRSSMLFNAHALSRAASMRHGLAGPKSLAMTFVEQITKLDEYSLVEAAKHRLRLMQDCERMLSAADDRTSDEKEAAHQLGLMLAEQLLQELQQRVQSVSKDAKTTPPTAEADTSQITTQGLEALGIEMPDDLEADEADDKLTNLRNAYGTIHVRLASGTVVPVPQTPDGSRFSGAYGRVDDFRKRARHVRAALIQHNPAAFQEEMAEIAEDQSRAMAERAQVRYKTQLHSMYEPRLTHEFMQAVKYLQSDRPYFLPPVIVKQGLKRPPRQGMAKKAAPVWVVDGSVFEARKRENEGRDVFDTEKVKVQQFNLDWQRVVAKTRFRRLVGRSDEGVKADEQGLDRELAEVRQEFSKYREHARSIFNYYGSRMPKMCSDDMLVITMGTWLEFCQDSQILDNLQRGCSTHDLQNVFVAVNFEEDKETADADANDDDAMMRFEFYEGLVRAAFGKFIETKYLDDASDAVAMLMEAVVLPHIPPEALVDPNDFRRTRLYNKEMHDAVTEYFPLLQAIHRTYRAKDRTKFFWIEHWSAFLDHCHLMGGTLGLTKLEAKLLFTWSQLLVSDELRRRKRALSLTVFDLIEVLARLADTLSFSEETDLDEILRTSKTTTETRSRKLASQEQASSSASGQDDSMWAGYAGKMQELFKLAAKDPQPGARARRKSMGLLSTRTRPLHVKFNLLMQYVLACMREQWGGKSINDCAARMMKMASIISGGIELG